MSNKKIYVQTLGCEKNEADSDGLRGLLRLSGYTLVETPDEAQVMVVNTCGFIETAVEESMGAVAEAIERKRDGGIEQVVVTGCLVSRDADRVRKAFPDADALLGSGHFDKIHAAIETGQSETGRRQRYVFEPALRVRPRRPFSSVKIAEGCNRKCSFCTIPSIRGLQTSRTVGAILDELSTLAEAGVAEALLVSQDSTQYGNDLKPGDSRSPETGLVDLLRAINEARSAPRWVRLHYTYPTAMGDESLIEALCAGGRVLPYLDIPLQHSEPDILRAMRRPDDMERVRAQLLAVREKHPEVVLRTTMIVGFPGETDSHFEHLMEFVDEIGFEYLSAMPFSVEAETPSAQVPGRVPQEEIAARVNELVEMHAEVSQRMLERFVDRELDLLVDGEAEEFEGVQARFYGQSPDVDGIVALPMARATQGEFIRGTVTAAYPYELEAERTF